MPSVEAMEKPQLREDESNGVMKPLAVDLITNFDSDNQDCRCNNLITIKLDKDWTFGDLGQSLRAVSLGYSECISLARSQKTGEG